MTATITRLFKEDHVSVSRINRYLQCPRSYRYRYIDHLSAETRSSSLVFGSAIHEALALFYQRLKDGEPETTPEELYQVFVDRFEADQQGDIPVMFSDKETPEGLLDLAGVLFGVFLEQVQRPFRVVEVEMPFSIALGDTCRLVGVFDAVVQDEDLSYRVLEHKTALKRWGDTRIASDLQITVYHLVAPMVGLDQLRSLDVQLLLKTKKSGMEVYSTHRTDADRNDALETIEGVTRAIAAGAFYPCRDWWCGSCEFAARCLVG